MIAVQIGKYNISKKGILYITFVCFVIGVAIGGIILPANGNYIFALFPIGIATALFYPKIKKEITSIKRG